MTKTKAKPFLRQVAEHYISKGLEGRIFVFPNKRSIAFFKKHVSDILKESGGTPVIAPVMMGVSEFFSSMTGRRSADHITLLLKLYESYKRFVPGGESLDDFLYWGDSLLGDFDDVDKYDIKAEGLFSNILDLKAMESGFAGLELTEEQIKAIRRLSGYFSEGHWTRTDDKKVDVKDRFLKVWAVMYDIYTDFRSNLIKEGMAYEGMVYSELAHCLEEGSAAAKLRDMEPSAISCVFVGLNTLNKCERTVLTALRNEGLAEFCWDFSGAMLTDKLNQASHFMWGNVHDFPNAFELDPDGLPVPDIHVVAAPSATAQAKVLGHIIDGVDESERGLDFAVVLPDETMLIPVLSSLPSQEDVNVTMGYSLASSEWNALMRNVIALQVHAKDAKYFYHSQVSDIFSTGIIKGVASEEEKRCMSAVQNAAKAYVPLSDLQHGDLFSLLFKPVLSQLGEASSQQVKDFAAYLVDVVESVAGRLDKQKDALQLECAYRYLQCVRRLEGIDLPVLPRTFIRLLEQLIARISVPFTGEPLGGLQVMGPLETRALDFKHLVILSANEGVFPGRNSSSSVIPPELRKAFGLPTYELQDTIWAYYFYRMICRSEDVWMVYDSRTEGLNSGEESRYLKQLRYMYPDKCNLIKEPVALRISAAGVETERKKSEEDMLVLKKMVYSASSINLYLKCSMAFYYHAVKNLKELTEVKEDLDSGMLGNICHDTLQAIYCCEEAMSPDYFFDKRNVDDPIAKRNVGVVTEDFLKGWISRSDDIRKKVKSLICHTLHCPDVEGRDLVSVEIAMKYILEVLESDLRQLQEHGHLEIVGLEKRYLGDILGRSFIGFVDRIDRFEAGTVRIVDYKTGGDKQDILDPEQGAAQIVNSIFNTNIHDYKAAFQFFIYDKLARTVGGFNEDRIYNSMYSISDVFTKKIVAYPYDRSVANAIEEKLKDILEQIENPDAPFVMAKPSSGACDLCDYRVLCGRTKKGGR